MRIYVIQEIDTTPEAAFSTEEAARHYVDAHRRLDYDDIIELEVDGKLLPDELDRCDGA